MVDNWDRYLDPPDVPEEAYCESCGEIMVEIDNFSGLRDMKCPNKYCPDQHTGIAREIAVELADTRASLEEMRRRNKYLIRIIEIYNPTPEY